MLIPWKHQIKYSREAATILREHMIVYLAWEERTGKSYTALLTADQLNVKNVLILTKKKALPDWLKLIKSTGPFTDAHFAATNYHNAVNIKDTNTDMVILDESHNYISAFPKIGTTAEQRKELKGKPNRNIYDQVKRLCKCKPIIYLSATPHAQGYAMLYHQLSVSSWSPWRKYSNFYRWHDDYGIKYTIKLYDRDDVVQYDKTKQNKVVADVEHLFLTKTRKELGFEQEPKDVVHYIQLDDSTKTIYNTLVEHKIVTVNDLQLVCDTASKLKSALHMLEGGVAKIDIPKHGKLKINYVQLANREKIDYILNKWGDVSSIAIMYNFIGEGIKLRNVFKNASILQATSYAEGVDLMHIDSLIIYSQDYSTARHTQRRARQCNKMRTDPINIHYLLVKKAVSEQCYKRVAVNKKNFVDSVFKQDKLR